MGHLEREEEEEERRKDQKARLNQQKLRYTDLSSTKTKFFTSTHYILNLS
jgi:hypothetical protein